VQRASAFAMQNVLGKVKDPETRAKAVEPLIRVMRNEATSFGMVYAPAALGKVGEPALEPLLQIIVLGEDGYQSLLAASALEHILRDAKDLYLSRRVAEPLIRALGNDSPATREQAAAALGQIFSSDDSDAAIHRTVVVPLIELLQDDSHEVHTRAAMALEQILVGATGSSRPEIEGRLIEDLLTALQHDCPNVRRFIATALGGALSAEVEPELQQRASESLLSWLEDPNEDDMMRVVAAEALGRIIYVSKSLDSARRAVPFLIVALKDERQPLRFHASLTLGQIVSAVADPKLAREAVPALITALQDKNTSVREHAAESLGRVFAVVRDPKLAQSATRQLIEALEEENVGIRRIAAWALVQIGSEDARSAVRNAGFDPDQPPNPPRRRY
jgi:HEAT repeat protein